MRSPAACLCALLIFAGLGRGQPPPEPVVLSEAEQAQLQRDKILVGTRQFRQSFEPYLHSSIPSFVTSDAVLNAFHVIFEESFARVEAANAPKLEVFLEQIARGLPQAVAELKGVDQWKVKAAQRAEIVLKTALRLLGRPATGSGKAIEQIIAAQVKEVEAATGQRMPEWLGPPDNTFLAVDFTRYAPRGFYNRSPRMQRYFRATAWLQSVPFRVVREEELLAALLTGRALGHSQPKNWKFPRAEFPFFDVWTGLLPEADNRDVRKMMHAAWSWKSLELGGDGGTLVDRRAFIEKDEHFTRASGLNDQLRLAPPKPGEVQCRVLPSFVLPDALLFQSTSYLPALGKTRYPDTLELAAGLGSAWATARLNLSLPDEVWREVHPAIKKFAGRDVADTLYDEYLACLRELVNEPDRAAPPFMKGEPWQRKSCQTLLSSWAQMRHTLLLQAKLLINYAGDLPHPAGFVEPDPEFFRLLGELSARCLAFFSTAGTGEDTDEFVIIEQLQAGRDAADALHKAGGEFTSAASTDAINRAGYLLEFEDSLPKGPSWPERAEGESDATLEKRREDFRRQLTVWAARYRDALDQLLKKIAAADPAGRAALIAKMNHGKTVPLASRWLGLIKICSQAQDIAHCELRALKLTSQQNSFVGEFGILLARATFHDGNSYLSPRDDAPRIADVFTGEEGHLHAGIGRPRAFYVLYPSEGKEVLCRGAVLPYFEFKHGPERLTDAVWMERLKKDAPALPKWVQPVYTAPEKTGK